jgi:hypothetical protein
MRILLAILIILLSSPVWAANYYMREDGNAANKVAATACGAVGTAMSVATHNEESFGTDTVYLCNDGGNFTTLINTPSNGVTYDGQPGAQASKSVIAVASGTHSFQVDTDNVTVQNLKGVAPDDANGRMAFYCVDGGDNCAFDNIEATAVTSPSNTGHIGVRLSATGGIVKNSTLTHLTIGVKVQGSAGYSITIEDNTIHTMDVGLAANADCISFSSDANVDYQSNAVVRRNTMYDSPDDFIDLYKSSNVIVEHNTITGNTIDGGEGNGIKLGYDSDATGNIVRYNTVHDLNGDGANYGIITGPSGGHQIYKNLLYDMVSGIMTNGTGSPGGNTWYNNTVYNMSGYGYYIAGSVVAADTVKNNILDGTTADIHVTSGSTVTGGFNLLVNDSQTGIGTYTDAGGDDVTGDPQLDANYHPTGGSPALDAGTDVSLDSCVNGPDIGYWEFCPTVTGVSF